MDEKIKAILDKASEIYLWLYIEAIGGFIWRMNHDLADGRIDSTPGIEKDLVTMQGNIEYAVTQLVRFGIEDPSGLTGDKYWEWYHVWKKHIEALDDADYNRLNDMLKDDESNPCPEFSPHKPLEDKPLEAMFFGKKLKELRLKERIGLRNFSEKIKILASELSDIERGYAQYPDSDILGNILLALGLAKLGDEYDELMKLYKQPFVMQKMQTVLPLVHATRRLQPDEEGYTNEEDPYNTRPATTEELQNMHEWFTEKIEEHNKKADEHNKANGVF